MSVSVPRLPPIALPSPIDDTTFLKDYRFSETAVFSEVSKLSQSPKILRVVDEFMTCMPPTSSESTVDAPEILHIRATMKTLELQDKIHEAKTNNCRLQLLKACGKDIHPQFMEDRCKIISSIAEHLKSIVQKTEAVQRHLQQPTSVDFLPLNFQHHKSFKEICSMIHDLLEQGDAVVTNVEWACSTKDTGSIDKLLNSVQQKVMDYHSCASKLQMFHDTITKYCELHAE